MHELGVIVQITKSLAEIAETNKLTEIGSVTLEIGEVSGIIPSYFEDCWQYYRRKNELIRNAELIIEIKPGVTFCEDCRKIYETVKYGKECPFCENENTFLVEGNECIIKQIEAR